MSTPASSPPGLVGLRVARGPLVAPVLCRTIAIVLARAGFSLDRIDDALILCDAIAAHAPAYARDDHLSFALAHREGDGGIELRVAELRDQGASGLIRDALLPDVGNPIERFSDARRVEQDGVGGEALILTLGLG